MGELPFRHDTVSEKHGVFHYLCDDSISSIICLIQVIGRDPSAELRQSIASESSGLECIATFDLPDTRNRKHLHHEKRGRGIFEGRQEA